MKSPKFVAKGNLCDLQIIKCVCQDCPVECGKLCVYLLATLLIRRTCNTLSTVFMWQFQLCIILTLEYEC